MKLALDAKSKDLKRNIYLSITHERKTRQYSLGFNTKLTKEEFQNPKLKVTKEINSQAKPFIDKASRIIDELGDDFSFYSFNEQFRGRITGVSTMTKDIVDIFNHYLLDHRNLAQGTIDSYRTIINHLTNFHPGIKITDLNVETILKIQEYIRKEYKKTSTKNREMSETTMCIYMRSLRALYNYAQKRLALNPMRYPFGKDKIEIISNTNRKRALKDDEFQKLIKYHPVGTNEEFAFNMFLISFSLIGMNMADIITLKNKNIVDGEITYYRSKTVKRVLAPQAITVDIPLPIIELINKYGKIDPSLPDEYVFPFINNNMSEKQILRKRKDIDKRVNKYLKQICEKIGIVPITTYYARHTIATKLYNDNVSINDISRQLGHSNIQTTTNYLGSLGLYNRKRINESVCNYLNNLGKNINDDELEKMASDPLE